MEKTERRMKNNGIVTSVEEQRNNKNRYSVFIDGRYAFSVDDETLFKSGLKAGDEITEDFADSLIYYAQYMSCKEYGFRLVSQKMYTEGMLREKLTEKKFDAEITDAVCIKFRELGLIDDEAYARAYISDASKLKNKGKRLIMTELMRRGVDKELINELLEDFENPVGLEKIIAKKLNGVSPDRKTLNRLFAACMRKGYNSEEIKRALKKYSDEEFTDE